MNLNKLRTYLLPVFICFGVVFFIPACFLFRNSADITGDVPSDTWVPVQVSATDGIYHDRVLISWDALNGAFAYMVYRSSSPDGTYEQLSDRVTDLYFDDYEVETGTHYFYSVTAFNIDDMESHLSQYSDGFASSPTAPPAPAHVLSSDGSYYDEVSVAWDVSDGATYYRAYRAGAPLGPFIQHGGDLSVTAYEDYSVQPGQYFYKIAAFNSDGEESAHSAVDPGYRALTDQEFLFEYNKTVIRSNEKLVLMHNDGSDAIGEEIQYGDVSGTCMYKATGNIWGADVAITYSNYCDYYLVLNGTQETNIGFPAWDKDGSLTGTVYISGLYNGYVCYALEIVNGDAGGGYYYVSQNGGPETQVSWEFLE